MIHTNISFIAAFSLANALRCKLYLENRSNFNNCHSHHRTYHCSVFTVPFINIFKLPRKTKYSHNCHPLYAYLWKESISPLFMQIVPCKNGSLWNSSRNRCIAHNIDCQSRKLRINYFSCNYHLEYSFVQS